MQMPQPTPQHRALEVFAGEWSGTETLHPSPFDAKGGTARALVRNVVALDGFAVIQDYEQMRGELVNFRGHGVIRFDAHAGEYVFHWFDSWGGPPAEFRGTGRDGRFILTNTGQQGHTRATFDFPGDGTYRYAMQVSPDGTHWATFMDGTYTRRA
ncbi:MAG: DUF1579 family protein [Gemmatimonadetes bacterium]|nr:DUF1579 family protein [Gemmatimonadota bacterium]